MPVAKQLGAYQEQFGRIETFPRPHQPFIPPVRRHIMRRKKNGIVMRGIQMTISAVYKMRGQQHGSALGLKSSDHIFMHISGIMIPTVLGNSGLKEQQKR